MIRSILFLAVFSSVSSYAQEVTTESSSAQAPVVEETLIVGVREANFTEITQNAEKLVEMPGSLGDPLGAITALPGVITPSNGGAPAVRGSSPDDNRYYIDGIPAGYIFHDFNTSIFDENVVQDFQLFSAGFGAQYSQATGAVFDVRLRDPRSQDLTTTLSASLLRAGVFLEGGVTENSAFYLSARQGLIQYFLPEEDEANDEGIRIVSPPEDSDYQFKYLWDVNNSHQLGITLAGARDFAEAEFTDLADFVQKNPDYAGEAMIDHEFNSQGVTWRYQGETGLQAGAVVSHYADEEAVEWGDNYFFDLNLNSIQNRTWVSFPLDAHTLTLGNEYSDNKYTYDTRMVLFVCTEFDADCGEERLDLVEESQSVEIAESSIYLIDSWQVTDRLLLELGLHHAGNDYNDQYFTNPRFAFDWAVTDTLSVVGSSGQYNRTPNIEDILPTVGNPNLKSLRANHYTLGVQGERNIWSWSLEAYYKHLWNLPLALAEDALEGEPLYSNDVKGEVRGVELFINRDLADRWYGWAALSYSESQRTNTRTGQTQNYRFDTPLVLNVVGHYQLTRHWDLGVRFTAKSGESTTAILDIRPNPAFEDRYLPVYGEPYEDRLPAYMRLDFRAERELQLFGKDASFFVDVINALNRENISERQLDYERVNETGELHIEETADTGVFGSVGISVTF